MKRRIFTWLLFLLALNLMAVAEFFHVQLTGYGVDKVTSWQLFVPQILSWFCATLFVPFLVWWARRFRISRERLLVPVLMTILAGLAYCVLQPLLYVLADRLVAAAIDPVYSFQNRVYLRTMGIKADFGIVWWNAIRYYDLVLLGIYGCTVGLVYGFDYYKLYRKSEFERVQLQASLTQARLQALTLQLQPHFLFNTLNSVTELMYEDLEAAERMLVRLSDLLRLVLSNTDRPLVSLQEEMEKLDTYLDIERIRFADKLRVSFKIAPEAKPALVPFLVLQPLVENAVRHGVSKLGGPATIEIGAWREGAKLHIRILNQMPSPDNTPAGRGEGLGLRNIGDRLRQLYGADHGFESGPSPQGNWMAHVTIPFAVEWQSGGTLVPQTA